MNTEYRMWKPGEARRAKTQRMFRGDNQKVNYLARRADLVSKQRVINQAITKLVRARSYLEAFGVNDPDQNKCYDLIDQVVRSLNKI